jgi:hypothetical protein
MKAIRHTPLAERFWLFVDKSDGCWEWRGFCVPDGYGRLKNDGKQLKAHRVSWELHNGPIPDGMWVLHHCDNRKCVRPDHLFLGTHQDNMDDMTTKGRRPTCDSHGMAKLTREQVAAMRQARKEGLSYSEIGKAFGVHNTTAHRAVTGLTWQQPQKEGA